MSTTNNLIPVTVADVVGRSEDEQMPEHLVVVLHDEARDRILPIWVGSYEAQAIAMGLREFSTPRPMTYNFLANLLTLSGVEIVDIRIDALRETTYYGVVRVRRVDTTSGAISELDARPSDALALALHVGCPIYAAPEVMEKAASSVPEEYLDREWQGRGAALVLDEMETLMQRHMAKKEEPDDAVELKERDARDSLLKQLFGDG